MTNFRLNTKESPHHAAKNTNRMPGFLSKMFSVKIGNKMITREAQIQFVAVEKDTIFGCTTSGIYSQTTGPNDTPNTPMYRKRPTKTRACPIYDDP